MNKKSRWMRDEHSANPIISIPKIIRGFQRHVKIKESCYKEKKYHDDIKPGSIMIEGIKYKNIITGKNEYADYEIVPVPGVKGLYRVLERMMDEQNHEKKILAREKYNAEVEKAYLQESEFVQRKTREMYMLIDYPVILQLIGTNGIKKKQDAIDSFAKAVEFQQIKKEIFEKGDKKATSIYSQGKFEHEHTKGTWPRQYGYIGSLRKTLSGIKAEYNLNDPRAKKINDAIYSQLFSKER